MNMGKRMTMFLVFMTVLCVAFAFLGQALASTQEMDFSKSTLYWSGKGVWKWDEVLTVTSNRTKNIPFRTFSLYVYYDEIGYWVFYKADNVVGLAHSKPAKQRVNLVGGEKGRYIVMPWSSGMTFFLDELRAIAPRSSPPAEAEMTRTGGNMQ
jgi:hypothetical protein